AQPVHRPRVTYGRVAAPGEFLEARQGNPGPGRECRAVHHAQCGAPPRRERQNPERLLMSDDPQNTLILTLKTGEVKIALRPDLAPNAVALIKALAGQGLSDNIALHP